MKRKVSYYFLALAFIFSACSEDLTNDQEEASDMGQMEENQISRSNDSFSECEFTVHSDGLSIIKINDEYQYVTRFKLTNDYEIIYAYCANLNAPCYDGARYMCAPADDYFTNGEATKIMAALTYIMNQYGEMETTNLEGIKQMTQSVIWSIVHGYRVTFVQNVEQDIILEAIHYVCDNIDDLVNAYKAGVTLKGENNTTADGLFVNYGPYQISGNALLPDVEYLLTISQNDFNAQFINETGIEITQVKPEEPFYIRVTNDVSGDLKFSYTPSSENVFYVNDYQFFIDVREGEYQQLFRPVMSLETEIPFYSSDVNVSITSPEPDPEPDPEPEPKPEKITLTGLNWNNGNGCGNGNGINSFTVNGITLKNNKNYVTPANFNILITKTPGKKDVTALYTVTERTVAKGKNYIKVYDIKVALYSDGVWKGYGGSITVDNPGGNNKNQQVDLERIF